MRKLAINLFLTVVLTMLLFAPLGCAFRGEPEDVFSYEMGQRLRSTFEGETPAEIAREKEHREAWEAAREFYTKRLFTPAWIDGDGVVDAAGGLIEAIGRVEAEGLEPSLYGAEDLAARIESAERQEGETAEDHQLRLVELDLDLTYTFMTLAAHLARGRTQPETAGVDWHTEPREVDLPTLLEEALEGEMVATLSTLAPPHEAYARLKEALERYRGIAEAGGWPLLPEGTTLKKGASGEPVAVLARRLAAEGDLSAEIPGEASTFDGEIEAAVKSFQERHGLEPDGVVGGSTLTALTVTVEERIAQIEANLERWRWLPADLGERYVWVNVPQFEMRVVENGEEALGMRVVVGKTYNQTPVFSDRMTYMELNPAWNIPVSIATEEVLPKLAEDPTYLERQGIEVVAGWQDDSRVVDPSEVDLASLPTDGSVRLRQRPGRANPLGKMKFMFPNQYNIYLHDSPADHLFARTERDFSHGCIRLERPLELAEYLLSGTEWNLGRIEQTLASGERRSISLPEPIPVHILYWTTWVDDDGRLQVREDLYEVDERVVRALAREPEITLASRATAAGNGSPTPS